mgnify:FL=1
MNLNLNVRALRIAYNQFFVNVIELSDAELLSAHFKYVEQIDENEDYLHGNIPVFEILCPLEHMEDILPVTILDMVLDLYADLVSEYGFEDPNTIVINKAEVVEVLSINAVTANGNSIDDKEYQEFKDYYTTVLEDLAK